MKNILGETISRKDLRIDRAAIKLDDGRVFSVDRPGRHHDVIRIIRESGYDGPVGGERQGFVLNSGIFARRKPALNIALNSGQVNLEKCVAPGIGLFSEDVW
jgi:hypothetical protein